MPSSTVDGSGNVNFVETDIATVSRTSSHLVEMSIQFKNGEGAGLTGNDVVTVKIDGVLKATGTTWEEYYRNDVEQASAGNQVPTTDSLLFREAGTASAGPAGQGFLVDDIRIESHDPASTVTGPPGTPGSNGAAGAPGSSGVSGQSVTAPVLLNPVTIRSALLSRGHFVRVRVTCPGRRRAARAACGYSTANASSVSARS